MLGLTVFALPICLEVEDHTYEAHVFIPASGQVGGRHPVGAGGGAVDRVSNKKLSPLGRCFCFVIEKFGISGQQ